MKLDVKGDPGDNNTFQDTHMESVGNYNPIATHITQNIFIKDPNDTPFMNLNAVDGEIMDMYHFSYTHPQDPVIPISRQIYIDQCEESLENNRIMFMSGKEGVGLTTLLAQFAQSHPNNCVSYFYSGLDLTCIDPEVIEGSIVSQLLWYLYGDKKDFDYSRFFGTKVKSLYQLVLRKINHTNKPLYFAFDGFDKIPTTKQGGVKRLFEDIFWEKARYIFTGDENKLKQLIPDGISWSCSHGSLLRFTQSEVDGYFLKASPNLTKEQLYQLYVITRGNAHRMDIVVSRYIAKNRLKDLLEADITENTDLYQEDFHALFSNADKSLYEFFALLAYAEFPVPENLVSTIIKVDEVKVKKLIKEFTDFVVEKNGILSLRSEGFHRYLRKQLEAYKKEIELKIVGVLTKVEYKYKYSNVIPSLYKSLHQPEKLIDYLSDDNIREIFLQKRSQASINEHCDLGFEACEDNPKKHLVTEFGYALNKTFSREIEKNELWDNEVEALLTVGKLGQALLLADNVYLKEERLKYYLLIAARKKELKMSDADFKALKESIDQLINEIDFENIPGKALELAKLLLPVDYEAAISIVDKIAMKHKKDVNTDRLYSIFSLIAQPIDPEESVAKRDLATQKIVNEDLRKFTRAAQGLFADDDVDTFLTGLDKLQKASQKLQLIRYWLPENEGKKDVGKVVLKAIQLIVNNSDADMPKAKVLNDICQAMDKMSKEEMEGALPYIDGMGDSIKLPTVDYVDAELTIIEAIHEKMPEVALSRLGKLYEHIYFLKDAYIRTTCLAKLLGRFDYLGIRKDVENTIGSTVELRKEVIGGVNLLLSEAAYHLKVVEGPIAAIVCGYPSMVDELIQNINTKERKSRAYSFAASQYLLQEEDENIKLDYFFSLLSKADDSVNDRIRPLLLLTDILAHSRKLKKEKIYTSLVKNFSYVENVENSELLCQMLMRVYIWSKKNLLDDDFLKRVKTKLLNAWNKIDVDWHKITIGFYIAKSFAPYSREDANKMIERCTAIKKNCFLSTSSCEGAFYQSLDLYAHSLCQLISLDICNDELLQQFSYDVDQLLSPCEKIRLWGIIAMEYALAGNYEMFRKITEQYFPSSFSDMSVDEQKFTIFMIAPALYMQNSERFFTILDNYDEYFRNTCLSRLCAFIIKKQTFDGNLELKTNSYDLSNTDYNDLLTILAHSTDDDTYYHVIQIIGLSLPGTYQKDEPLTSDMKKSILNRAKELVNKNLPTPNGIKHDGYKIVCLAALEHEERNFSTRDKKKWEDLINTVNNKADQAFLYFDIAPYFANRPDIDDMIDKGIKKAESLDFTYDKVTRLEMAATECADNNLGYNIIKDVAMKACQSLAANGDYEDNKHLIDTIYQCKPDLADELIESMDQDPARIGYKNRLVKQIDESKRIDSAQKDTKKVSSLNRKEQKRFFNYQLESLMDGTGQILDIDDVFSITVPFIYHGNISDTEKAVFYLLKTIGKKAEMAKNQKTQRNLLLSLHDVIRNNLRLVLSIAAGTKDRINHIDDIMLNNVQHEEADNFIPVGGFHKAETYLLNWYRNIGYNNLVIIDPYLKPDSLNIIKKLTNENTKLHIRILTHPAKNVTNEDYKFEWHKISDGIQTPVKIDFVWYKDKPEDCPLHDRYWICFDDEQKKRVGLTLPSVNTLGMKESSINPIDDSLIADILLSQTRYSFELIPSVKGRILDFDHTELD